MFHRFIINDMKIYHSGRQTCMPETLLHVQNALAVLEHMARSTMPQGMDGDCMVKATLCQGVFQDGADIAGPDGLGRFLPAMGFEDKVITGILLLEATQHGQLLVGYRHTAVFLALTLIDEYLTTVKTDVYPFEATGLADSDCKIVNGGEQGLVIQVADTDKSFDLFLGEHTWKFLGLPDSRHNESVGLCVPHKLVVILQTINGVPEEGIAAAIPVQKHEEIVINVFLGELFRKLVHMQDCLRNLHTIVIDSSCGVLSKTEFLGEQRHTVPESADRLNRLIHIGFFHRRCGAGD